MRLIPLFVCLVAALLGAAAPARAGDAPVAAPADPLALFLPDPALAARLQPLVEQLESDRYARREEASRQLAALPALPAFLRELAATEARPESRARLRELVAAFPLETENEHLGAALRQIAAEREKGRLDAIIRVMRRGLWTPADHVLHEAAAATATRDDLPLIRRALDDPAPVIRRLAAAALGGLPPDDSRQLLARLLSDPDPPTALLAADALATGKDPRALAAYLRLLDDGDFATRYRSHAALGGLSGQDFGYDPAAPAAERAAAAARWRSWASSPGAAITGALPRDSSIILFNGKDLQGWAAFLNGKRLAAADAWETKDGCLRCNGRGPGDLWTTSRHENYVLGLEYKFDAAGHDSGVGILLTEAAERGPGGPGYLEVQLLPGRVGDLYQIGDIRLEAQGKPLQFTCPRAAAVDDPPGCWHALRLTVRDGAAEVEVDGVKLNRAAKGPRGPGRIVLRNEGNPVAFRKILLQPLPTRAP